MTQEEYENWKLMKYHKAFVSALIDAIIFRKRFAYITPKHYDRFNSLRIKYNIKDALDAYPFIEKEATIIYNKRHF